MQESTNDNYSDIKYSIFHSEYDIEFLSNKKTSNNYMRDAPFEGAASLPFQYGGFVKNKANTGACNNLF